MNSKTIIFPCAGPGLRPRSIIPKALLKIGDELLLQRQITAARIAWPDARIIIVIGFGRKHYTKRYGIEYLHTSHKGYTAVKSIAVGLSQIKQDSDVVISFGDLFYDLRLFADLLKNVAYTTTVISDYMPKRGESCNIHGDNVVSFTNDITPKWGQIIHIAASDFGLFRHEFLNRKNFGKYTSEVLNDIVPYCNMLYKDATRYFLSDIDSSWDLRNITQRTAENVII